MANDNLKYLNDSNFTDSISKGVTLVDFFADWCGPCKMVAPIIEELAGEFAGVATIAKIDIENAREATEKMGVTSIPTIIVFKDGKEVQRVVGVRDKAALSGLVRGALG